MKTSTTTKAKHLTFEKLTRNLAEYDSLGNSGLTSYNHIGIHLYVVRHGESTMLSLF
jgi:hypothetical protein